MKECPLCGYDPEPKTVPLSDAELRVQRIKNTFIKNLMNSWWLEQPKYVCSELRQRGIRPNFILDVGCGDGRWVPGILEAWPGVHYTGVDPIEEHIKDNKERMAGAYWVKGSVGDFDWSWYRFDLVLLGGTLQERAKMVEVKPIIEPILELKPKWIVTLMDKNTPWQEDQFRLHGYSFSCGFKTPKDLQGPLQDTGTTVYERS